jgi:hypothetical protein
VYFFQFFLSCRFLKKFQFCALPCSPKNYCCAAGPSPKKAGRVSRGLEPLIAEAVLVSSLPAELYVFENVENGYRDEKNAAQCLAHDGYGDHGGRFVLFAGDGVYCLNTEENREFLKEHPNLDWNLNEADRVKLLEGRHDEIDFEQYPLEARADLRLRHFK